MSVDVAAAVCTYLDGTSVAQLAHGIYRPKLPANLPVAMPAAYVVCRRSGGYALFGSGPMPLGDPRVEFDCYGESELDADRLAGAVIDALRGLNGRQPKAFAETSAQGAQRVLLRWARIESGPIPLIDPDSGWPSARLSAQIAHTELPV